MPTPKKQEQKMRFSDADLSLVKNTFAENPDLLKALRKVFLQIPLDALDKQTLTGNILGKPTVMKLIRKCYLPEIDADAPIHQVIDLWMTVDIKDKDPDQAWHHLVARDLLIKYLEQQLHVLDTLDENSAKIRFADLTTLGVSTEKAFVNLIVRNQIVTHNEQQLAQLTVLAGMKNETVEQTKERLKRDSAR